MAHRNNHKKDYAKLSIGPEISGIAFINKSVSKGWSSNFGYSFGGQLNVRPFKAVGLTTGLTYNKINNGSSFYDIPIIINYFTKNDLMFSAGPILLSDPPNGSLNFQSPTIGGIIGFKKSNLGLWLFYDPDYVIINKDTRFFLGLLIKIQLLYKVL